MFLKNIFCFENISVINIQYSRNIFLCAQKPSCHKSFRLNHRNSHGIQNWAIYIPKTGSHKKEFLLGLGLLLRQISSRPRIPDWRLFDAHSSCPDEAILDSKTTSREQVVEIILWECAFVGMVLYHGRLGKLRTHLGKFVDLRTCAWGQSKGCVLSRILLGKTRGKEGNWGSWA